MATYSESHLALPALLAIMRRPGITTTQLIRVLTDELEPSGPDLRTLRNRRDTHFSQKVRNLVSHKKLLRPGLVVGDGTEGWRITDPGMKFVETEASLQLQGIVPAKTPSQGWSPDSFADTIIEEGSEVIRSVRSKRRSEKLRETAVDQFRQMNNGRLFCLACHFDFLQTYGEQGRDFIEMHHTTPISQADVTRTGLVQALRNQRIVPLCSNCHSMVHRYPFKLLSIEELKSILASA